MRQMCSRDAAYLFLADGHVSATVVSAWVLDASGTDSDLDEELLLRRLRTMADIDGHLRSRVQFVPWSLGLPYWRLDRRFDVADHFVRHPRGRTWPETVDGLVAIGEQHLPLDRPLWRAHLLPDIDGVPGRHGLSTVLAIQWHHAAVDGLRWSQLSRHALSDTHAGQHTPPPTWSPGDDESGPVALAVTELLRAPATWWRFVVGAMRWAGHLRRRPTTGESASPARGPRTRFSGPVRGPRICSFVGLEMSAVTSVRRRCPGATVNDVMLSVIGGAFREHVAETEGLPDASLTALVPVSSRSPVRDGGPVNQFAATVVDLHTDIDDVLKRVDAVSASASHAKSQVRHNGAGPPPPEIPAPLLRFFGWLSRSSRFGVDAPTANVVVSNVGGTPAGMTLDGLPVDAMFGMQTLERGCLLAHSIRAVGDRLTVSVTADATVMPDPAAYLRRIERSLESHRHAATSGR